MGNPIKHFPFWLHVAEFAALKRMRQSRDPAYPGSTLAKDDLVHLSNVVLRLLDAYAGVPIGPAETSGVTNAVDPRNADPASETPNPK